MKKKDIWGAVYLCYHPYLVFLCTQCHFKQKSKCSHSIHWTWTSHTTT